MKNIIKNFKSTILGFLLIGTSIYLLINGVTTDYYINGGLMVSGVLLLFAPDKFINQLEKIVLGKTLFEKKSDIEL